MEEIGLFPLGIVLLPSELVPLHIFEPRYRELVGECLDEEREFGLVLADDDGLREIGTKAAVVEVVDRFPDGRLNVVVEGRGRFRLLELTDGRSFHTGTVDELVDSDDPAPPEEIERALALFRRLLEVTGADVEPPDADDPQLSFSLAGRFELAAGLKQQLLQATSERTRLVRVCEILEAAAAAVERQREIAALAGRNGRVQYPTS
ncbi:MAG: LON peptidase substrate-binding domain-containing protein [Thermoleophilia bacterium]|nr:LON peptidase substrate-binding domain-containing protein [Thermoleophilia bacterium]MDH5333144.1 LON peptidase substrate-binding domain-containing protein [Thermoleophilia bacterium]